MIATEIEVVTLEPDAFRESVWLVERTSWEDYDILGVFYMRSDALECAEKDVAREKSLDTEVGPGTRFSWRVVETEIQ